MKFTGGIFSIEPFKEEETLYLHCRNYEAHNEDILKARAVPSFYIKQDKPDMPMVTCGCGSILLELNRLIGIKTLLELNASMKEIAFYLRSWGYIQFPKDLNIGSYKISDYKFMEIIDIGSVDEYFNRRASFKGKRIFAYRSSVQPLADMFLINNCGHEDVSHMIKYNDPRRESGKPYDDYQHVTSNFFKCFYAKEVT